MSCHGNSDFYSHRCVSCRTISLPSFIGLCHKLAKIALLMHLRKYCIECTAYTGLFDRSLLNMSLNQLELALKNTTSKSNTPVSMYQFDPLIVYEK